MKKVILTTCCVLLAANFALADWNEGDPFKMHFPQLPDPLGWDVNFMDPKVLADDWACTESGPVSDIHFWFSSRQDLQFQIQNIHASIHKDIPAGADPDIPYSRPGQLLWQRDFSPLEFRVREYGTGFQGWYDPNTGEYEPDDHLIIHQVNIVNIRDPFPQEADNIYWLDLSVKATGPGGTEPVQLGWKTSLEHFMDDAVWADMPWADMPAGGIEPDWQPLMDPITGETLDLAFVITPEPGTILLLLGGLGGLLFRRRR